MNIIFTQYTESLLSKPMEEYSCMYIKVLSKGLLSSFGDIQSVRQISIDVNITKNSRFIVT